MIDRWFGPLFLAELRRLTRGRWLASLRTVFGLGLLATMAGLYMASEMAGGRDPLDWFGDRQAESSGEAADFGASVLRGLLLAQTAVLAVLVPVVVGLQLHSERQRGLLELLRTTGVGDEALLAGKLGARVICLGSLLLVGLPVVAAVPVYGGVEPAGVAVAAAVALVQLVASAVASLAATMYSRSAGEVLFGGLVASAFFVAPGVAVALTLQNGWMWAIVPAGLGLIGGVGISAVLLAGLGSGRRLVWALDQAPGVVEAPDRPAVSVGRWPLWWKETHRGGLLLPPWFEAEMIIPCLTVPGLSLVYCVAFGAAVPLAVMAVVLAVIFGGFTAAGLVARERERGTLETLLCVPVDRGALLGAKWLAAVWSAAGPLVVAVLLALGCAVSLAFWAGGPPVLAAAGWAAVAVGQTTLAVSLGLWLSVHSATATRAQLWFAGLVIAGWAVVWVGSRLAPGWLWAFTGSFCPPSVVRVLSSRGDGEVMATWHARDAAGLWLGATTQAAVAVVLALLAWRRFAGGKALGV